MLLRHLENHGKAPGCRKNKISWCIQLFHTGFRTVKTVFDVLPAVNQIEFHPLFNHPELLAYCQTNGIAMQAYAPLARGAYL